MSNYQRSDGWEALRARLEAAETSGFRGGWVPRRRKVAIPESRGACAVDADQPGAGTQSEAPRGQTSERVEAGTSTDVDAGTNPDAASSGRPPLTRAHLFVVGLVTLAALAGTLLVLWNAQPSDQAVPLAAAATATPAATAPGAAPAPPIVPPTGQAGPSLVEMDEPGQADEPVDVVVHVAGKVRRPGVVRLPAASRVIDAIDAAGGARKGADLSAVNLARQLQDGEQVRVGLPPDPNVNVVVGTASPADGSGASGPGPLDLNTAGVGELESLPGIGPVLSQRIVAYREESGPFHTVDQLIEVPGIGPAVLSSLKDLVHV